MFVHARAFHQPSLKFEGMARSLPKRRAPERCYILEAPALFSSIRLCWKLKACQEQTHYLIMNISKLKPQQKFYSISLRLDWLSGEKHSSLLLCSYYDNEKKFYQIDSRRTHRTTSNHTYEITSQTSSSVQKYQVPML